MFEYPNLDRVTNEDGTRFYTCPDTGLPLASVTTILSATADKKYLEEWQIRVGEKEAEKQRNYGSGLGSLLHEHIEKHILGIDRPKGTAPMRVLSRNMADQIIKYCLPHVDEVWGIEVPLYYSGLYAGTTDLIGVYKKVPSIIDHKNAKKMKKKEDIIDYRDQLCAYMIAHNNTYGTDINQGVVFMVDRGLECKTFVWEADEVLEGKTSFLTRLETYLA